MLLTPKSIPPHLLIYYPSPVHARSARNKNIIIEARSRRHARSARNKDITSPTFPDPQFSLRPSTEYTNTTVVPPGLGHTYHGVE